MSIYRCQGDSLKGLLISHELDLLGGVVIVVLLALLCVLFRGGYHLKYQTK